MRKRNAEHQKKYRNNPELRFKHNARWITNRAVNAGKLVKTACVDCGSTIRVEAHHKDYYKPLDVIWLCNKCHDTLHSKAEKGE